MAIVYGTGSSETINASDGVTDLADTIYGYGGNDTIFGLGGNDFIVGGLGGDTINGGSGLDAAFYTDSATGVTVNLSTGKGSGGSAQGDTLISIENLYGSSFDDVLIGNSGNNSLSGMDGNDILKGAGGADVLSGGGGNDTLLGGTGADILYGGGDIDTVSYAGSSEAVYVFLHEQQENFGGDAEGDELSGIENLTGSSHNDRLDGNSGANVLSGGDGNDTLVGLGGADTMIGGEGDDDYYVHDSSDVIVEAAGEGEDSVGTQVSYTLAAGVEVEYLLVNGELTTTDLNLTGNEFAQYIGGNEGNNIVDGGGGADTMEGRGGNDTYYVDNAGDVVIESGGGTFDALRTSVSYNLAVNADIESFRTTSDAGFGSIDLTGNNSAQQIVGNAGSNMIAGGGGNDTLSGLGGEDAFIFNAALGPSNVDIMADYNLADDQIRLDNAIFTNLFASEGNWLTADEFMIGSAAADANDRIIYNSATGALLYDADGSGAGAAVQFATLSGGVALTSDEFFIV